MLKAKSHPSKVEAKAKRYCERLCFHRYLSVHRGEGCLPHCMLGYTPLRRHPLGRHPPVDTPLSPGRYPPRQTPPGQTSPFPRQTLLLSRHLLGRHPPPPQDRHPHSPGRHLPMPSACWDTVNKRTVRIPLECILVFILFYRLFFDIFHFHVCLRSV